MFALRDYLGRYYFWVINDTYKNSPPNPIRYNESAKSLFLCISSMHGLSLSLLYDKSN